MLSKFLIFHAMKVTGLSVENSRPGVKILVTSEHSMVIGLLDTSGNTLLTLEGVPIIWHICDNDGSRLKNDVPSPFLQNCPMIETTTCSMWAVARGARSREGWRNFRAPSRALLRCLRCACGHTICISRQTTTRSQPVLHTRHISAAQPSYSRVC